MKSSEIVEISIMKPKKYSIWGKESNTSFILNNPLYFNIFNVLCKHNKFNQIILGEDELLSSEVQNYHGFVGTMSFFVLDQRRFSSFSSSFR